VRGYLKQNVVVEAGEHKAEEGEQGESQKKSEQAAPKD
jgi:hypothetical protein